VASGVGLGGVNATVAAGVDGAGDDVEEFKVCMEEKSVCESASLSSEDSFTHSLISNEVSSTDGWVGGWGG
jgi:hypothetical protein